MFALLWFGVVEVGVVEVGDFELSCGNLLCWTLRWFVGFCERWASSASHCHEDIIVQRR
jgi:hypothetical protein